MRLVAGLDKLCLSRDTKAEALVDTVLMRSLALDVNLHCTEEIPPEAGISPSRQYHRSWGNSLDLDMTPARSSPSAGTMNLSQRGLPGSSLDPSYSYT